MREVECPICGAGIPVGSPDFQGEVECPDCGARLFVVIEGGSVRLIELREEELEFEEEELELPELEAEVGGLELEDDLELEDVDLEDLEELDEGLGASDRVGVGW